MSAEFVEIKVPALGESVVEATVTRWHKKPGDSIAVDEILVELETDKVTLEVAAPVGGSLESQACAQGGVVQVGGILGLIKKGAHTASSSTIQDPEVLAQSNVIPSPIIHLQAEHEINDSNNSSISARTEDSLAPSVAKLIKENELQAAHIKPTGKDGRLTKEDILHHLSASPPSKVDMSQDRLEKRTPMSRLRQRIAQRLKEAQQTAAILTTFNEVDMSAIINLRTKYKEAFEKKHNVKLGFMSFFVKASVHALQKIPFMNSRIEENDIITSNYYDIGVAVSAPQGLVVPVIRDADLLNYADIEREIFSYGQKAKENKLTLEEISGGTFTISNGGTFGSLLSTPIINPPQSGILGMHKIQDRPVVIEGRIEVRPMMYLALSYDHRLIDGREAVTFLVIIKGALENPGKFLLGL